MIKMAKKKLQHLAEKFMIVAKIGKQGACLLPIGNSSPRVSGQWKGKVSIASDFDTLPKGLQPYFKSKE